VHPVTVRAAPAVSHEYAMVPVAYPVAQVASVWQEMAPVVRPEQAISVTLYPVVAVVGTTHVKAAVHPVTVSCAPSAEHEYAMPAVVAT